ATKAGPRKGKIALRPRNRPSRAARAASRVFWVPTLSWSTAISGLLERTLIRFALLQSFILLKLRLHNKQTFVKTYEKIFPAPPKHALFSMGLMAAHLSCFQRFCDLMFKRFMK